MGEIDDVTQVQDQRQPECHQHVERTDDEPVGDVEEEKQRHNSPVRETSWAWSGMSVPEQKNGGSS